MAIRAGVNAGDRQVVFQVQHPEQAGLLEDRQAQDRPCMVLANVVIGREWVLARGVMQQHAFLGSQNIAEDGLRQIRCGDVRLPEMDLHLVTAGRGFRFDPVFIPLRKNQHTSFGAGVLDGRAHERVDQLLQDNLTRQRLGHLDHGCQIEVLDGCLYRGVGLRDGFPP